MALQPVPSLPNADRVVSANLVASTGPIPLGANFPIYGTGEVEVYQNGVLVPTTDYTLSSASGVPLPWTDAQVVLDLPQTGTLAVVGNHAPHT